MKYALGGNAWEGRRRPRALIMLGAGVLVLVSVGIFMLIIRGNTRIKQEQQPAEEPVAVVTSTESGYRRLDGMLVPKGDETLPVFGVMIENHVDARPLSGPSKASIVFEYPVEGGITRLFALFDSSSTIPEIGPVRSARPYYVETARAWNAAYFHVGGSPQALELAKSLGKSFLDVDEFRYGPYFWRSSRSAPHNVYISTDSVRKVLELKGYTTTTAPTAWHFQDLATTTERGDATQKISVPFGGSYDVTWTYDKEKGIYKRYQAGRLQKDADGTEVEMENVIVIKTTSKVLDPIGRLEIKTVGSGDAVAFRDGKKSVIRWNRSPGEPFRFTGTDGTEYILTRGQTWISVATEDKIFDGAAR